MPPRYAYWTILVDNLPTAFRATTREDLQPTFEQLRRKNPTAVMRWFARGTLWDSPEHAGRAGREAGERRAKGWRPGGDHRDPRERFERERKAKNAARRQERFDQKVRRRGPDGADRRPSEAPPRAAVPDRRPGFEDPERPQGRGFREERPREGRRGDERDHRAAGTPPAKRPFDKRGDRPRPHGARPFDTRDRPQGRGPRDERPRGDRDRPDGKPPEGGPFDRRGPVARPAPHGTRPRDRPHGRGPRDDRPWAERPRDNRDRPPGRPFDNRGRPGRPDTRVTPPFDTRDRPEGRGRPKDRPRDDRSRGTNRERPQGYKPVEGRPVDSRGPAGRGGSRDHRPYDNRARPQGRAPEGSPKPRAPWKDGPRERDDRFRPVDRDEHPHSPPAGERRGHRPPRPEGPPPGPDRPPRPGQEPPPVPARTEDIVIPPEPPERGRNADGPSGTRLIKRPGRDRR